MINKRIAQLINYGITRGLIEPEDQYWARNGILSVLGLDSYQEPEELPEYEAPLEEILKDLLDDAKTSEATTIRDFARPPVFIPETKNVADLLKEFRSKHNHMAIVIDE